MLHELKEIRGYDIGATDGSIGTAKDFYFDDRSWRIRYLVVNTGWLFGRNVLIAPEAIRSVVPSKAEISVSLTREQIEQAPGIGSDLPVSKQEEQTLRSHYSWPLYWDVYPVGLGPLVPPLDQRAQPGATDTATIEAAEKELESRDPDLRSANEVEGYRIAARDGEIGHVDNFIVDDETWLIRYLVVDTRNWLPGRKVLVAPNWATGVNWSERFVTVELTQEAIRNGPQYEPEMVVDRAYETRLHRHYDLVGYWE